MDDPLLAQQFDRAERALERIERALAKGAASAGRDSDLRDKVRGVVAELDELIRTAGGR